MGSEWSETTLGQLTKEGGGFIQTGPFGSQLHASDYVDEGIPVIMPVNMVDNRVSLSDIARITEADAQRLSKHLVQEGDIVYSRRGDVTRKALITSDEVGMFCGTGCLLVRPGNQVDPQFLKYHLSTPENQEWIIRHAIGATMPNLNTGILGDIPLRIPSKKIQKKIAEILGTLDNKIALNRQINTTLESMAQVLFKSWFVDFDPVIDNALAAGNEIPDALQKRAAARAARREALHQQTNKTSETTDTSGATDAASVEQALPGTGLSDQRLPSEIQQLFPDRFVLTEEMGWVPEGWEVVNVEHILKRLRVKKRYKKGDVSSSGRIPVYEQGTDILLGFHDEEAEIEASVNDPAFIFGDHTCVTRLSTIPFSISENVIPLKPSKYDGYWTYHAYRDKQQFEEYRRHWMELIVRPVVVPTPQLASTFGSAVRGYYERSELVMRENTSLEDLRDSLLPKLLSGQITIPDAEQQLAEVL